MFDKVPLRRSALAAQRGDRRQDPEDARIALRCNRKEIELIDSFVANGEFESRSELMRAAVHAFLRTRALSAESTPPRDSEGFVEVPVRLRPHEFAEWSAYAHYVDSNHPLRDVLARFLREAAEERNLRGRIRYHRDGLHDAVSNQEQAAALRESGKDLERRGVVGR
ncbi:MAG: ribbon-helix-helix domain-containing protein [Thermoplasmata archaeon]